jgi:hypothetical protein
MFSSHKALRTQELLTENVPDFWHPKVLPVTSPSFNSLDYFALGYMLGKIDNIKFMT